MKAMEKCTFAFPTGLFNCRIFLTEIHADFECDVHFPDLAPFGLDLNSKNKDLDGVEVDCRLVEDSDESVETDKRFSEGGLEFTFRVFKFVRK